VGGGELVQMKAVSPAISNGTTENDEIVAEVSAELNGDYNWVIFTEKLYISPAELLWCAVGKCAVCYTTETLCSSMI